MRISEILNQVNTFEKNNFLRIIESILSEKPKNFKKVDKILRETDGQIKNADNLSVENIFKLISDEYTECIKNEFKNSTNQLDIIVDILIKDGNSLMSREWLLYLYKKEVKLINSRVADLSEQILGDTEDSRIRDYRIYKNCVQTAYFNDQEKNLDKKVTDDEQSILNSLIKSLELSHEEVKLINYSVIKIRKLDIDDLINYLVKSGIIFYSKKNYQIFVPEEIVKTLRKIRGRELPNKIYKRVLKTLKPSQINLIARKHNIPFKLTQEEKQERITSEGVNFSQLLLNDIHKVETNKTEKKKEINDIIERLDIDENIGGASLEDKVFNFIKYLNKKNEDDNISISLHGFERLLLDLNKVLKKFEEQVKNEFEFEEKEEINANNLLLHNIKPLDILYLLTNEQIKYFCEVQSISNRGNEFKNILDTYRDTQNLYLENYINISNRDLNTLKNNQIDIKESEIGIKYEELTKLIFKELNLNVDDDLRKNLNTKKDKIDILIKLHDNDVMIVECKTKKDRKFSIYSSASRQIKAYKSLVEKAGYKVVKTFIVAPDFTDDFVNECGEDYELNLSLITSQSLIDIYNAFVKSNLEEFPYKILLRDVLINSERVVKSILK